VALKQIDLVNFFASDQPTADSTPPTISNRVPASGAIDVASHTSVAFRLDDVGDGVDLTSVIVNINSVNAYNGSSGGFQPGFTGTVTPYIGTGPAPNGYDFVIQPVSPLPQFVVIPIHVFAADRSVLRNTVTSDYSFTTADETAPTISNQNPAPNQVVSSLTIPIDFQLNDPLSGIDTTHIVVDITEGSNPVEHAVINGVFQSGWTVGSSITSLGGGAYAVVLQKATHLVKDVLIAVHITAKDLKGNQGMFDYSFSTNFAKDVDAIDIGKDGGGPVTINAHGLTPGVYTVFLGPNNDTTDPQVYNGIPGSGGLQLNFVDIGGGVSQYVGAYLPPLPTGVYGFTFVPTVGNATHGSQTITVLPVSFKKRTMALRSVLPPWYKTGIRSPDRARYPQ
jgi:hypothetical protein